MRLFDFLDEHIKDDDKESIAICFACFLLAIFVIVVIMLVVKFGMLLF